MLQGYTSYLIDYINDNIKYIITIREVDCNEWPPLTEGVSGLSAINSSSLLQSTCRIVINISLNTNLMVLLLKN